MAQRKKLLISIIVPIYNEAQNIEPFFRALRLQLKKLPTYSFEIIAVNDGSTDDSAHQLRKIKKRTMGLRTIELVRNFGKEIATSAGLHNAKGAAAIMIDADFQHPIEIIPDFLKTWETGAEVVIGIREPGKNYGFFKAISGDIFYLVYNRLSKTRIVRHSTDFQLLDRCVINEFNRFTEHSRITRGLISWLGFRTKYISFTVQPRQYGKATYSRPKLLKLAISSFVSLSLFPLRLAGYLGLLISTGSALLGIFVVLNRYVLSDPFGFAFSGTAVLAVFIMFMSGITLSCLGLIALYIEAIHQEILNRPLYVVRTPANANDNTQRRAAR